MTLMYTKEPEVRISAIYITIDYRTLNEKLRRELNGKDILYLTTLEIELDLIQSLLNILLSHKAT
jgi:hypothetical protein